MSGQIRFFNPNLADYSGPATATASENASFAYLTQDRRNTTAWVTNDSEDSNDTTFTMNFNDIVSVTDILMIKHNFASYKIKYWNGTAYVDFATAINVSGNTASTTYHQVTSVMTSSIQVTILGTIVPNSYKYLYQFIATTEIGTLNGWPVISKPNHSRNRQVQQMLSSKQSMSLGLGAFSCTLAVSIWSDSDDLDIVETLFGFSQGFLVWLCGGDEDQFSSLRQGYRMEDIYLMRCTSDYQPQWESGLYQSGLNISIDLAEVVT